MSQLGNPESFFQSQYVIIHVTFAKSNKRLKLFTFKVSDFTKVCRNFWFYIGKTGNETLRRK